ncbi:MAG: phosphoribosyltransferase family protein [Bacteroidia bacterium]
MSKNEKILVVNHLQMEQKINRMAYQIYENNYEEKNIFIAGIAPNGYLLAQKITKVLEKISPLKIQLLKLTVNKENPLKEKISLEPKENDLKNKVVILVDDVLNSGQTLIYGANYFLNFPLKQLRTAVLVDRNHTRYPVKADYIGVSLSTTLQEHIDVELDKKGKEAVYLM